MHRRSLLTALASGVAFALAGCTGDGGGSDTTTAPQSDTATTNSEPTAALTTASAPYGSWFRDTGNYDGTVDRTGQDGVRIAVGASGNGGDLAYEPAAVEVSTGTTAVWEWTGEGGQHNVLERDGEFESALVTDAGHTFSHRFRRPGTFLYVCVPHKSLGMRGAVQVTGEPVTRQRPRSTSRQTTQG